MENKLSRQEKALILSRIAGELGINDCQKLPYTRELTGRSAEAGLLPVSAKKDGEPPFIILRLISGELGVSRLLPYPILMPYRTH